MIPRASEEEQQRELACAVGRVALTVPELWLRYFALGGDAGLVEVEAYLHGLMPMPALQRDILAHAVNERLAELPHRVRYSRTIHEARPQTGPLAALVDLLEGAHLAPPEDLPAIATAGGRALDVGVAVYVIDYDQLTLNPLVAPDASVRHPLGVDTTLAGRAFRRVEIVPVENESDARLWVPLLDGSERLGVLEITLADRADLRDPLLRDQLRWLSMLLGHLFTSMGQYGDALHAARLQRPRTPAAELIWSLLPPLTAGTGAFSLAAMLEPSHDVGGDAFDYAFSETTVHLAIFDAMGHALGAGLIAAAALAAYRAARRAGCSLPEQVRAVDETIAAEFGDAFITGVICELDLTTGRLRYLAAGHPHPLLLRHGRVVKRLARGRRAPFGLDIYDVSVGEETLEPGDWLILHTDGLTEARDAQGRFFGEDRLSDFLEREAASGHPPPETARRLVNAVMEHQHGVLQDDATVLLARWDAKPSPDTEPDKEPNKEGGRCVASPAPGKPDDVSSAERHTPSVGETGGLPGANANPATGQISEDEMADTVSMGESAGGGEPRSEKGETSANG